MDNEYGFFTSKNHDRRYSADDFVQYFKDIMTDGVLGNKTSSLMVTAGEGLTVSIGAGTAYMGGRWYRKQTAQTITLADSDTLYARYDAVVVRCDYAERKIYAAVIEGIPSESPQKPEPSRDESYHDLILAYVYVDANAIEITQAEIEDTRGDNTLCGWVTGAIDQIDTTDLFAQYEAQWELLKAACAQDEEAVIKAWDALNTVKRVNDIEPVNGNVSITLDNIPDSNTYFKQNYQTQMGYVSSRATSVTFEKSFSEPPFVYLSGWASRSGGTTAYINTCAITETGFTLSIGGYDGFYWIAFGKLANEEETA